MNVNEIRETVKQLRKLKAAEAKTLAEVFLVHVNKKLQESDNIDLLYYEEITASIDLNTHEVGELMSTESLNFRRLDDLDQVRKYPFVNHIYEELVVYKGCKAIYYDIEKNIIYPVISLINCNDDID